MHGWMHPHYGHVTIDFCLLMISFHFQPGHLMIIHALPIAGNLPTKTMNANSSIFLDPEYTAYYYDLCDLSKSGLTIADSR